MHVLLTLNSYENDKELNFSDQSLRPASSCLGHGDFHYRLTKFVWTLLWLESGSHVFGQNGIENRPKYWIRKRKKICQQNRPNSFTWKFLTLCPVARECFSQQHNDYSAGFFDLR